MKFVFYDIQHPTDPQVNGLGFYRSVLNGTDPLLVTRKKISTNHIASVCHPWEAADLPQEQPIVNFTYPTTNAASDVSLETTSIAFDADDVSLEGTTDITWTHTPVGTPKGIIVFITQAVGNTDEVTGVTYGGVNMARFQFKAITSGSYLGAVYGYFLGSGIPTGAQSVVASVDSVGSAKICASISVTSNQAKTTIITSNSGQSSFNNVRVKLDGLNTSCYVAGAMIFGGGDPAKVAVHSDYTQVQENDFGARVGSVERRTAIFTVDSGGGGFDPPSTNVEVRWACTGSVGTYKAAIGVAIKEDTATAGDDRAWTASTQQWENVSDEYANSEDDGGLHATYRWEISDQSITERKFTWCLSSDDDDSELGTPVETDNGPPPNAHIAAEFQECIFLAGDSDNPHYLYFSKRFRPEAFPDENFLEIGNANDPITGLTHIAGVLGVFTRDTKYRVSGTSEIGFAHHEAISYRGTRAGKSCVPTDRGVIFVANDGVFITNFIGPDTKISSKIESLFVGDTIEDEDPINMDYFDLIAGVYHKSKYRFVYPSGTSTTIDREAVYDFDTETWTINDISVASYFLEEDVDTLAAGGQDGKLYQLVDTNADNGTAISYEFKSKSFEGESYNARNLFHYFRIDAQVGGNDTMTAKFYVDDELMQTATITGTRTNVLNPLPENTFGFKWRVDITGTSRSGTVKIFGFATLYTPLIYT